MLYLILAVLLFTLASLLSVAASRRADASIVSSITQVFTLVIPFILLSSLFAKKAVKIEAPVVWMAVAAGLAIGLFAVLLNKSYAVNKVGIVVPVVYGGTILLSTVLSYFIFKETIKGFELVGLLFVLSGISFIIYARAVA